ncbi:MAG: hypothetical protein RLY16_3019 [Bacteroidota bacterium]
MKKILQSIILLFTCFAASAQQDLTAYSKEYFIQNGDTLPYRLLLPENYDASKKYPLIMVLHGAGERGNDNELQLVHGAKLFLQDSIRKAFPAIVVFPQCKQNSFWAKIAVKMNADNKREFSFQPDSTPTKDMALLMGLTKNLQELYKIKKKQIYVGGLSMGGMGTFELVYRMPKVFAAAFPICGGGNPASAASMKKTVWWIFHGAKDNVVDPQLSIAMEAALKEADASVKLTIYPNAYHNSWDDVFKEKELLPWLFSQHR